MNALRHICGARAVLGTDERHLQTKTEKFLTEIFSVIKVSYIPLQKNVFGFFPYLRVQGSRSLLKLLYRNSPLSQRGVRGDFAITC
jgi:hypothetical protein